MDQNEFVYNINHLYFEDIKPVKRNFKMKKRAYTDKKLHKTISENNYSIIHYCKERDPHCFDTPPPPQGNPPHLHYINSPLGHISGNFVVVDLARMTEYLKRMKIPC